MIEPTPVKTDTRLATGITVAAVLALLLAVGLATLGDLSPPNARTTSPQGAPEDSHAARQAAVHPAIQ